MANASFLRGSSGSLRTHARQQEVLAALGELAIGEADPGELMDLAATRAAEALEVDALAVLELLPGGQELRLRAASGRKEQGLAGPPALVTARDSLAGFILQADGPVVVRDLRSDRRFSAAPLDECGAVSAIGAAIRGRRGPWGVLIAHSRSRRHFGDRDTSFVRSLANLLALATERHELEMEQRREGEILRSVFDHIPVMISLWGEAGDLRLVNREWERTLGWSLEEAKPTDILTELYPDPEQRREARDFIRRAEFRALDFRIRARHGRVLDTSWTRLRLSDGTSMGFGIDISERKRAERELRLLQAITQEVSAADDFRSALQVVMAKVCQAARWCLGQAWIPSADGTVLEWGAAAGEDAPALERFRQVSRGHVFGPGQGLPGACWQAMRPVWRQDLTDSATFPRAAAAREAGLTSAIAAPVLADGKVVAVIEFFVIEARAEDEHFLGLVQTISTQLGWLIQRKRAEDALRESEQRFRQLAETINEVFWLADPPCSKMLYVNPAYEEVFGRSRESLYRRPRSWTDAVHAEDRERVRKVFLAKSSEQPLDETYRIVRPDGSVRWIRDRGYPIRDSAGTVYRFAGVAQDVTDGKRAEQERERRVRQLQALADAAQAIGAAGSVHEIATVVTDGARRIIGAHLSTSVTVGEIGGRSIHAASRLVRDTNRPLRLTRSELELLPAWAGSGTDAARQLPLSGILAVPLVGRDGKNLGVIQLADKVEGAFGEEDEAILAQLAQVASEAIENACLLQEVTASRERLETLSRRLVHLQEVERRTIARELHDEVGQLLTGLKFMLETGDRGGRTTNPKQAIAVVAQLLEVVSDLSLNLRPPMLDDLGLVPTLLWHFEKYQAQTGVQVRFRHSGCGARLPADTEITAFRIIQEALTNVARHAGVTQAGAELWAEDGWLGLRVEDCGKGFDPAAVSRASSGLTGMGERARLLGGSLSIESRPGAGSRLLARLPVTGR